MKKVMQKAVQTRAIIGGKAEILERFNEWKDNWIKYSNTVTYGLLDSILKADDLPPASKLHFIARVAHYSPKDLYIAKGFLSSLYAEPELVPDPWQLNYIAFHCIGVNPNQELISNFVNSLRMNALNPSLYTLSLVGDILRKKLPVQKPFLHDYMVILEEVEENCCFYTGDAESFTSLCLACKDLKKFTGSQPVSYTHLTLPTNREV
eukprot:TRINITY_DN17064_c0_g2_i2.p1 TRINITY_DN17064_c0_g2~~TRINITY_DN17064_c0_g2_i2.p1  ORF type:complete len:207 (-),score=49.93 TRINITY_DN17064_c0_g2_i2:36-656(-)